MTVSTRPSSRTSDAMRKVISPSRGTSMGCSNLISSIRGGTIQPHTPIAASAIISMLMVSGITGKAASAGSAEDTLRPSVWSRR